MKIIIEKHSDGYIASPLGLKGAVADVKSAIRFHIETFGAEVLEDDKRCI